MESGTQAGFGGGAQKPSFWRFCWVWGALGRVNRAKARPRAPPGRAVPPRGAEGAALQLQPPQLDYAAFRDMAEVAVCPAIKSVVGGFR